MSVVPVASLVENCGPVVVPVRVTAIVLAEIEGPSVRMTDV